MSFLGKVLGKFLTYLGLLMGFSGIHTKHSSLLLLGVAIIAIGCVWHEANEQ